MDRSDNSYYMDPTGSGSHIMPPSTTGLQTILLEKIVDRLDVLSSKLEMVSQNQLYQSKDTESLYRKIDLLDIRLETVHQYNKLISDRLTLLENTNKDILLELEKNNGEEYKSSYKSKFKQNYNTKCKTKSDQKPRVPSSTQISSDIPDPYYDHLSGGEAFNGPVNPYNHKSTEVRPPGAPPGIVFDFVLSDDPKLKDDESSMFGNPMEIISKLLGKKTSDKDKLKDEEEEDEEEEQVFSYDKDIKVEDLGEIKTIDDLIKIGESVKSIKDEVCKELEEKRSKEKLTKLEREKDIDELVEKYSKYLGKEKKNGLLPPINPKSIRSKVSYKYPKPPTRKPPLPPVQKSGSSRTVKTKTSLEERKHIPSHIKDILHKYGVGKNSTSRMIGNKPIKEMNYMENQSDEETKDETKDEEITIKGVIENGLYKLGDKFYPFDLDVVEKLVGPLKKLNKMIGMTGLKESILDQILYYLQRFESKNRNMLHTVIQGPPGVGKTEVAKILCQVFVAMGAIKNEKIVTARRKDLVGEYVGHTAPKVEKIVKEADGGVLFIDEAYGLGGGDEKRDTFSREAVNTLTELLSLKKGKFICIIAGYAEELEKNLFSINPGMERRFPYRHHIDTYSPEEMRKIFMKMVIDRTWKISDEIENETLRQFFDKNKDTFPYYGGDIENLFMHCRNAHSRRVYRLHPSFRKTFNMKDIESGYDNYKKHRRDDSKDSRIANHILNTMYS